MIIAETNNTRGHPGPINFHVPRKPSGVPSGASIRGISPDVITPDAPTIPWCTARLFSTWQVRDPCRGGSGSRYTWRKISIASPSALKAEECCRQRLYATAGNGMVEGAVERFRMEFGVEKRGVASRSPGRTRGEDRRETCVCKINYLLNSIYSKGGVKNASVAEVDDTLSLPSHSHRSISRAACTSMQSFVVSARFFAYATENPISTVWSRM